MHKLLTDTPGKEMLLLGNEAIARGALEAGVSFATCYPGTPSSEIPEQFFNISRETDLYFEYSTNEKVAMEVGAAAAALPERAGVSVLSFGEVAYSPCAQDCQSGGVREVLCAARSRPVFQSAAS